ncbi:diadenylate cyclase CdaA [Allofustis seminis]|uniref:diadenylate cyclase CdaA n=1 Tax=Allofustis seminis TaxID=166939 RepID=UPI000382E8DC
MPDIVEWIKSFSVQNFWSIKTFISMIDILIVSFFIYQIIKILKGTRATELLKGILVIMVIKVFSSLFQLYTTEYIIDFVIQWSALALIVIFQPELRRALEHLGRGTLFTSQKKANPTQKMIESIADAAEYMGRRHIGALISLEMKSPLTEFIKTGIPVHADISSELLINIFIPNTPLHDGAVIIREYQIASAASYLPLSESPNVPKKFGTRHRAAIGLSEETDAITVVVSEETGEISIAHRSTLTNDISKQQLIDYLNEYYLVEDDNKNSWIHRLQQLIGKVVNN